MRVHLPPLLGLVLLQSSALRISGATDQSPKPEPFGRGIFAHIDSKDRMKPEQIEALAKNPYIDGNQLSYSWSTLEPQQGQYQWELVEKDMEVWAQNGKKCWIEIRTASKRATPGSGRENPTPEWVFKSGIPVVGSPDTSSYPVYWDTKYQQIWGDFIRAFARKFDGDPRIEFVSIGGYSSGHEPNLSAWDNDKLMAQWIKAGFDGFTPNGIYLNRVFPVSSG